MREMKDSGVEWLKVIPRQWKLMKGKYLFKLRTERGNTLNLELLSPTQAYGVVPQSKYENLTGMRAVKLKEGANLSLFRTVHKGDYCISLRSFQGGFEFSEYEGVVSPAYQIFYPIVSLDRNFYKYLFKSVGFIAEMNSFTLSLRDGKNIAFSDFGDSLIPYPELQEQYKISAYLDSKCFQIDTLKKDIEKQIETLQEYKKSIITQAVTKGLDPNVEMKDSGVEWIGKIPKTWNTIKIRYLFTLRDEKNSLPQDKVQLLSLYAGKGVFPTGAEGTIKSGNHAQTVDGYKIVKKDDIVVNIILAWMGAIGVSNYEGVCSPAYDVYIPNKEKAVPHFYHYVFRTDGIAGECYRYGKGIMMMRLRTYSSEFKNIIIPFPSVEVQQEIADYLDSKCTQIDYIFSQKQKQLDVLDSYKKSLIYEYVTGKKEVPAHE